MVRSVARQLVRIALATIDTIGPSRPRLALRRLNLRLRAPAVDTSYAKSGRERA
jgi:hypothetical protein